MEEVTIGDLKYGDNLFIEYGFSMRKAKYLGRGIAKINYSDLFVDLNNSERFWIYRKSTFQRIKEFFKN